MNTLLSIHGLKFILPLHRCHPVLLSPAYTRLDLFRFTFTAFRIFVSSVAEKNEPRGISGMATGLLMFPRAKHTLLLFQLPNTLVNKRKLNDKSNLTSWNLPIDGKQTSMAAHTVSAVNVQG